jgi:two-component system phosphate regulon sensor histidine kinase PhoR
MNPEGWLAARSGILSAWLAAFVCAGVVALAWVAHYAADEWTRASAELVEQRGLETADLVVTALARDMRAVQVSVLDGRDWNAETLRAPHLMNAAVQSAFARYPYPEVFFTWHQSAASPMFLSRNDRRPGWLPDDEEEITYPVEILSAPAAAQSLFSRLRADMSARQAYSLSDIVIGGTRYHVVARLHYDDSARDTPVGAFGFLVDLNWVRQHYFPEITRQLTRIAHASSGIDCTLVDGSGQIVVGPGPSRSPHAITRELPILFFDDAIITGGAPKDLAVQIWSVIVSSDRDPTLAIAAQGARRTLIIVAAGALALGLGLVVTARASRAAAAISAMRADFVSAVTHAFKTPVSVIRGVGETMIRGRVQTPDKLREYAALLVQEGYRLSRLVDNMLAYARITDGASVYQFEPHDVADIVDEVLKGFQRLMTESQFDMRVTVEPGLPRVRVDRTALILALDNLVDNAMRYSGPSRSLAIRVAREAAGVGLSVIDVGPGIAPEELAHVQRRFARGRAATGHGSGIGLAIAHRIAADHGGLLRLESVPGVGTTATLVVPLFMPPGGTAASR